MEMIRNHRNHPLPRHLVTHLLACSLVTNNSDLERLPLFPLEFSNAQTPNSQALQFLNPCLEPVFRFENLRMTDAKLDDAAALQHLEHLGVEIDVKQKRHEKTRQKDKYKSIQKSKTSKTNKDNTKHQKSMNTLRRSNIGTDTEVILRHVIQKAE